LAEQLGAPELLVYDATLYLPIEQINAARRYREAHIPGAFFFDIDAVADSSNPLPHMAPPPEKFAQMAAALGISADKQVIFYDQRGLFSAARGWWLLRLFGFTNVAVLDGGLPKWIRESRPLQSGHVTPIPAALPLLEGKLQPQLLRSLGDIQANIQTGDELILDARPAARFRGQTDEPRAGLRRGHIPHSRNLPYTDLQTVHGTLLPPPELRQKFAAAGVTAETPVIASCGSGVSAAMLLLALNVAGYRDGALYDGSWAEWGAQ
jgi:thiosulfate/3-mercaptopyruvate sulfurtransferase